MPKSVWGQTSKEGQVRWDTVPEKDKAIILNYAQSNKKSSSQTCTANVHAAKERKLAFEDEPKETIISVGVHDSAHNDILRFKFELCAWPRFNV